MKRERLTPEEARYLNLLRRQSKAKTARDDLIHFAEYMKPDPDHPNDVEYSLYHVAKHHQAIAAALEQVEKGKIKRLIINVPPRHGKSELSSRLFPAWFLGRHPSESLILATYADKLSWDFGREVNAYLEDSLYRQIFPGLTIRTASVDRIETQAGGKVFFVGRGSAITGRGATGLLIDDPIKDRVEADSKITREKLFAWFNQVARTRLVSHSGWIVIIQCMTGDTQISMADGSLKRLDEVRPGDRVVSWDGRKIVASEVFACVDSGLDYTYVIRTTSGVEVRANARHPFLVDADGVLEWRRTATLKKGDKILRATGGNTEGFSVKQKAAAYRPSAGDFACLTIARIDGRKALAHLPTIIPPYVGRISNIVMASIWERLIGCLPSRVAFAPYAELTGVPGGLDIGAQTSFPIIITKQGRYAASFATTATDSPDELAIPKFWNAPSSTFETVTEIVPFGVEPVYDLTVAKTHNFLANHLWTSNTRWSEDDLVGRLTDPLNPSYSPIEGPKWRIIDLPAIAGEDDRLGRKEGEALWPERFPVGYLEEMRAADPRGFQSLYQGSPTPDKGNFFPAEKLITYKRGDLPPVNTLRFYAASDHAVSSRQERDKTCLLVIGLDEDENIWVMPDAVWGRYPTDQIVERMIDLMDLHRPLHWWAEKGHITRSIGPFLRKRMLERSVHCSVYEMVPVADKMSRAQSILGRIAMGKVFWPSFAPWWVEAQKELLQFPHGARDDLVDTISYIGLGLAHQQPLKRKTPPPAGVQTGTLGWVKAQSRTAEKQRLARNGGW